jgi:catechol 2,3-dioxygenase-like lactoylglutathione lyase family enzyme
MFDAITHFTLWVTDQDEALEFYVGKLGLEVTSDVSLDFMRWLTVGVPGSSGQQIILAPLGPPIVAPEAAEAARELLSKGVLASIILSTPDCRATYETLRERGVEFTEEPAEQPYGIDCAARDPFGNQVRISQRYAS